METVSLTDVIKRSWLALIITALLFAIVGYGVSGRSAPSYTGVAKLLVGTDSTDPQALQASGDLGRTYADLATTRPVLTAAIGKAGLNTTVKQVLADAAVTTSSNDVTRIVEVDANAGDPASAARFANAIASELQRVAAQTDAEQTAAFANFTNTPAVASATPTTRLEILAAARQLIGAASPARLSIVDPATPPTGPASPKKTLTALLAAVAGVLLVIVLLVMREATGRRRFGDERDLASLESVGYVGAVEGSKGLGGASALAVGSGADSAAAERYRSVATNVAWLAGDHALRTLLVTSPSDDGEAGVVAANLAAVLAESNRHVILVDAASSSGVSRLFDLDGQPGYGEVLDEFVEAGRLNGALSSHLVKCGETLDVLPRGRAGGRALLDAVTMDHVRQRFLDEADVLVVTAPPVADSPAARAWARTADATLVVVGERRTPRANLEQALAGLTSVGTGMVGTVLVRGKRSWLPGKSRS